MYGEVIKARYGVSGVKSRFDVEGSDIESKLKLK